MRFISLSIALLATATSTVFAAEEELKIEVTHKVECDRKSKSGDNIAVHYRGTLQADGTEFDTSYKRQSPLSFVLGHGRVIKGWEDGLMDMCIGEKRILTIPPNLGYGSRGVGPIPADATLIFETELMSIEGVESPASTASESASSVVSSAAEEATEGVKEKIMSKIAEAAEAVKVTVEDTDGSGQEHNEL